MKAKLSLIALALVLSACGNNQEASDSNFKQAIQDYLNNQEGVCIYLPEDSFPFALANGNSQREETDSLVKAGLLSATTAQVEVRQLFGSSIKEGVEYNITAEGKKYLIQGQGLLASAFCTGKLTVSKVENFTQPTALNGATVSHVNFSYKLDNLAKWIKTPEILQAYPKLAEKIKNTKEQQDTALLLLTNKGWVHEKLFRL